MFDTTLYNNNKLICQVRLLTVLNYSTYVLEELLCFIPFYKKSLSMAAAFQQQIFALDARFNAYRAPGNPNFSKPIILPDFKIII